ncbi:MAG: VIT1/CCC1 transporter family protein [Candidatus Humimicrobiaceae bacterium]
MKNRIKIYLEKVKTYNKIANISKIVRRYFAVNGFDGVITIIGVLMGNYIIGTQDYMNVIITGTAVCISLGVSGVWSAYNSESAERKKEIDDLEKYTLHDLDRTVISEAQSFATKVLSAVNGLSPVITALIPIIPFFFGSIIPIEYSFYAGFALAFLVLLGIGLFLGKISKSNLIISGIKMVIAGGFTAGLSFLLKFIN